MRIVGGLGEVFHYHAGELPPIMSLCNSHPFTERGTFSLARQRDKNAASDISFKSLPDLCLDLYSSAMWHPEVMLRLDKVYVHCALRCNQPCCALLIQIPWESGLEVLLCVLDLKHTQPCVND